MKKYFMFFAAMLLMSVSVFAQSSETPLKGDVNEDGVVDVADINAIIAIIKNNAQPETTYYWYIGTATNKPTSLPTSDSELATGNSEGWRKYTATSGTVYDASLTPIRFDKVAYYWLIVKNGMKVETSDGNNYLNVFESSGEYGPDSTTISGYTIYASKTDGIEFGGIVKY